MTERPIRVVLVDDHALAIDDEGFVHAVASPVNGGASAGIGPNGGEGLAEGAEEAPGVFGLVLVVDAIEADVRPLG